jgi:hypothetical protein
MLRKLSFEWFNRRAHHGMIDQEKISNYGSNDHWDKDNVCDGDICFMLASMHKMRRDVNPHWWYVCNIH